MPRFELRPLFVIALLSTLAACGKREEVTQTLPPPPAEANPAPAAAEVTVHRFVIGELQAMALSDGGLEFPNDNQVLGVGLTPEDVGAVLSANGLATDKVRLSVQPLLVRTSDRVMLFDTGAGGLFGPTTGKLPATLADAGVDPASITDIFISHSHGDHVGGLVDAGGKLRFPNATVHLSQPEWAHMSGQEPYKPMVDALKPKVDAFVPGAELIDDTVRAVEVKGHTPGHSAYRITSGADSLLYIGDSMHHYVVSVQKPEWTIAFDGDPATASASRAALIAESAASGQRIYAVHFPFPGIGRFEKRDEGHAWAAE
jgi:glyoxylase-like metal-dependent hydrolase (beta-lactamase superfamily II)/predicted small lipoprotein YifL